MPFNLICFLFNFFHEDREGSSARIALPLSVVLPTLTPLERQFIEKLDKELDKVESFYQARESEAKIRLVGPLNIGL